MRNDKIEFPLGGESISDWSLCSASQFYEGYGQTECTAGCSLTIPGDWTAGRTFLI